MVDYSPYRATALSCSLTTDDFQIVETIKGNGVFTVAFSPDSQRLLTSNSAAAHRHETRLWKLAVP